LLTIKARKQCCVILLVKLLVVLVFFVPEVMVAVPGGITSTEKRAVVDATMKAGAKAAYIIKEPIAAAIGSNIPIGSASGHMIIDIGGRNY